MVNLAKRIKRLERITNPEPMAKLLIVPLYEPETEIQALERYHEQHPEARGKRYRLIVYLRKFA